MANIFRSLRVGNYRIYAAGALVSNVGTWMQGTAQAWLVLQLGGGGAAVGIAIGLQLVPTLLLSPFAGSLADRFPKRRILLVTQVAMSVPAAILGVLAVTQTVVLWHVFLLTLLFGVGRAFEAPARQAFVAEIVGPVDLSNAVALNSASINAGRLIGPASAGLFIAALGSDATSTGWVILGNALSYAASLAALLALRRATLSAVPRGLARGTIRQGLHYVRGRPDLVLVLVCSFFLGAFGMNFTVTSALMATQVFGRGAGEFGLLGSILAAGSLIGALLAAARRTPRLRIIVGACLAFAVLQAASGLMPTLLAYALVIPLVGFSVVGFATTANAFVQVTSDPSMRGRVASLLIMMYMGTVPLGAPLIGTIGELLGGRWALIASGAICAAGTLGALAYFVHAVGGVREVGRAIRSRPRRLRGRPILPPPENVA